MVNENFDGIRIGVLTDNVAQSVRKYLMDLRSKEAQVRTRWVWELLQNARDAGAKEVTIKLDGGVTFSHNGANFNVKEIAHLIYHGSTKTEDAEAIGQYGSGFLTTHLLSPEIRVSGGLEDGQRFDFGLRRELGSASDLRKSMDQAWEDFQASLKRPSAPDDSGTEFHYPLNKGALSAVTPGARPFGLRNP